MRTCSKTGVQMSEGWVFFNGEEYASTKEIADQIAKEYGFMNFEDMYEASGGDEDSETYWTTFEEEESEEEDQEQEDQEFTIEVKTVFTTCVRVKATNKDQALDELENMFNDGRFNELMLEQCESSSEVVKVDQEG